ncbi:MAG: hypothetical protein WBM02_01345 [bacterium]
MPKSAHIAAANVLSEDDDTERTFSQKPVLILFHSAITAFGKLLKTFRPSFPVTPSVFNGFFSGVSGLEFAVILFQQQTMQPGYADFCERIDCLTGFYSQT